MSTLLLVGLGVVAAGFILGQMESQDVANAYASCSLTPLQYAMLDIATQTKTCPAVGAAGAKWEWFTKWTTVSL